MSNQKINYEVECEDSNVVAIMKKFTETDLRDDLDTDEFFTFFDDEVIFSYNGREAGKTLGWFFFKFFCEMNLVEILSTPKVHIIDKIDYITWKITESIQRRKKCIFLPTSIFGSKVVSAEFEANVYFSHDFKINRFDIVYSELKDI